MRKFIIPLCFIVLVGCREELPIDEGSTIIVGYRIEGSVVDSLGRGLNSVSIRLAYTYAFVDSVPPESRRLIVPHAGMVRIQIFDMYDNMIRQIFTGNVAQGEIDAPWDYRDSLERSVGSGLFWYSFFLDGEELVSYPILIDSAITTSTDVTGSFTVEDIHFPVGYIVPRFSNDGTFLGNFLIFNSVRLIFELYPRSATREVTLNRGRLARLKQTL